MIAQVRGRLVRKEPLEVVVDVGGVGYRVAIPLSTFYRLGEPGDEVSLLTHTHVREDVLALFGFLTAAEQALFERLIAVSGVGPKLAVSILSGIEAPDLVAALKASDVARLTRIPGVGRKTAERLVFDLKEKIGKIAVREEMPKEEKKKKDRLVDDVVSALVNLGYRKNQAESVVEQVWRQRPGASLEEILKESLRALATG